MRVSLIYGCMNTGNECERREKCERFRMVNDPEISTNSATLWKEMCNEKNNYSLFMEGVPPDVVQN